MVKGDLKIIKLTFVNSFLIKVNEGFILIDTGMSMHWEKLENELINSGCLPDLLKLVVITHGDMDHTGNCVKLQEKYNAKIGLHKDDLSWAEKGVSQKRKVMTFSAKLFILIRKLFMRKFTYSLFKPDLFLTDGQELEEYGWDAKIVHIPGHTKGSIGILTHDGDLFAGDTFTNRGKPDVAYLVQDEIDLRNSLARLKELKIKTIYPGHGKPFEMVRIAGKL